MEGNEITTQEQVNALPVGTWIIDAEGTVACLFETHMGFPQKMWGIRLKGSPISSFSAVENAKLPLHLAEIDESEGFTCPHFHSNECGQCLRCGKPGVGERREMFFDKLGSDTFRIAAEAGDEE